MSLKAIIPKLELDAKVTVFTLFGSFSGGVGETNSPETSLTLHTSKGTVYFDIEDIKAVRREPDREF